MFSFKIAAAGAILVLGVAFFGSHLATSMRNLPTRRTHEDPGAEEGPSEGKKREVYNTILPIGENEQFAESTLEQANFGAHIAQRLLLSPRSKWGDSFKAKLGKGTYGMFQYVNKPISTPTGVKEIGALTVPDGYTLKNNQVFIPWGAVFHALNGFKPTPPGVTSGAKSFVEPQKRSKKTPGVIDPDVSLNQTMEGIKSATSVAIRNVGECPGAPDPGKTCEPGKFEEVRDATLKMLQNLAGSADPKTIKIAAVRNLQPHKSTGLGVVVKPHWCSALDPPTVIDLGSGQATVVEASGKQAKVWEYHKVLGKEDPDTMTDEDITSLASNIKTYVSSDGLQGKITAKATGKWRDNEANKGRYDKLKAALEQGDPEIPCDILDEKLEALYGSKSVLNMVAPYYPDATEFFITEMGGGSTQIGIFKKLSSQSTAPKDSDSDGSGDITTGTSPGEDLENFKQEVKQELKEELSTEVTKQVQEQVQAAMSHYSPGGIEDAE
eukprot:gnl/MRDRNA2_/MRDRNA2_90049_c0_seq1.p1 gnl/MRDRNA2_/MRDRNA2_90049_c0~~gnl/MRDRNA2_/MRDRNA2_90049_c0_seq1.p1  ORF type:complete len:527 (-),score=105.53 gnl/MRDRNA2_/MRDRNA2_90049_c0_seq1:269-1753(-)